MNKTYELLGKKIGKINPTSVEEYVKLGGFTALKKALQMEPKEIAAEVKKSNLMGRGGAAYPTGVKWEQAIEIVGSPKYVVCNGDEGEPGTYKDKYIMSGDPLMLIEGMIIGARVVGSPKGIIYIRGEYRGIQKIVREAIENAKAAGYLGENILGSGMNFDLEVTSGAGAYVCGENTALVESIQGKTGRPRMKPPYLKECGLYYKPTLLNNVETFASIPFIISEGGEKYASIGYENSGGTKLVCLAGNVVNRKVFEVPFGITLREIIFDLGQGVPDGKSMKFFQMGGNSGAISPLDCIDTKLDYAETRKNGLTIGSGAVTVVDDSHCAVDYLKAVMEFYVHESCGKCTPCREGNQRILELVEKLTEGRGTKADIKRIKDLARIMKTTSFCGLGQSVAQPVHSMLKYFGEEFEEHTKGKCSTGVCPMRQKERRKA